MVQMTLSRRAILVASLFAPVFVVADNLSANAAQRRSALTPDCDDDATPAQSAGPYYKPESPVKDDFTNDVTGGTPLLLGGKILDRTCNPLARCMIEFWQADQKGDYDNQGFRLRGHQFTDDEGRYVLQTIWPGLYPGRTRHIHVRVWPASGRFLTTQLYFPDEARNGNDYLFRQDLLIAFDENKKKGLFNFAVEA